MPCPGPLCFQISYSHLSKVILLIWSVIWLGRNSFLKHILVQRETKFVWAVSAQQEQNYSQIATFCDGILRKRDDMIISLNCSQCSRQYKRDRFSRYEISWEFSLISEQSVTIWNLCVCKIIMVILIWGHGSIKSLELSLQNFWKVLLAWKRINPLYILLGIGNAISLVHVLFVEINVAK